MFNDLTGRKFGRLLVIARVLREGKNQPEWLCKCDCGTDTYALTWWLLHRKKSSCGCYRHDKCSEVATKHGLSQSREYGIWEGIKQRCKNTNNPAYKLYGARGITVDPSWLDFTTFYADMGQSPTVNHSIERIDNDGPYAPWNCKWATRKEQNNNSRQTRKITFNGETLSLNEWATRTGIHPSTLKSRLDRGIPTEIALTTPPEKDRNRRITFDGETRTMKEWADHIGINMGSLRARLRKSDSLKAALTTPPRKY